MTITEETRNDLYQGLAEALGKQRAITLMEHLPPGGWGDVATKQDLKFLRTELDARFAELRSEMTVGFAELRSEMTVGFAELRSEMDGRFAELRSEMTVGFAEVRVQFAKVDGQFAKVDGQFAKVDGQFADLRTELHQTLRVHMLAMMGVMLTAIGIVSRLPG